MSRTRKRPQHHRSLLLQKEALSARELRYLQKERRLRRTVPRSSSSLEQQSSGPLEPQRENEMTSADAAAASSSLQRLQLKTKRRRRHLPETQRVGTAAAPLIPTVLVSEESSGFSDNDHSSITSEENEEQQQQPTTNTTTRKRTAAGTKKAHKKTSRPTKHRVVVVRPLCEQLASLKNKKKNAVSSSSSSGSATHPEPTTTNNGTAPRAQRRRVATKFYQPAPEFHAAATDVEPTAATRRSRSPTKNKAAAIVRRTNNKRSRSEADLDVNQAPNDKHEHEGDNHRREKRQRVAPCYYEPPPLRSTTNTDDLPRKEKKKSPSKQGKRSSSSSRHRWNGLKDDNNSNDDDDDTATAFQSRQHQSAKPASRSSTCLATRAALLRKAAPRSKKSSLHAGTVDATDLKRRLRSADKPQQSSTTTEEPPAFSAPQGGRSVLSPARQSTNDALSVVTHTIPVQRYQRLAAAGRVEPVMFGPTIHTAKAAVERKLKELRNKYADDVPDLEVIEDIKEYKRSLRIFKYFEDQEKLALEEEYEAIVDAMRRSRGKPKPNHEQLEEAKLAKRPVVFSKQKRLPSRHSKCPDQKQCGFCAGNSPTAEEQKAAAARVYDAPIPGIRKIDLDDDTDDEDDDNNKNESSSSSKKRRTSTRSADLMQRVQATRRALRELQNALAFVEEYIAGASG